VVWEFETRDGKRREGVIPVMIKGTSARCTDREIAFGKSGAAELRLTINASDAITGRVQLRLIGPDGLTHSTEEQPVAVAEGRQISPLPLSFRPEQAGLWHLLYDLTTTLPELPGLDRQSRTLAAGRIAVDAGSAAIIGLSLGMPVYYDAGAAAEATAYVYGREKATVELLVDGDRAAKRKTGGPGISAVTAPLGKLTRGRHRLDVTAAGPDLKDRRSLSFVYGARLPDLTVTLRTSDIASSLMEVGIGVMNQGRTASDHSTVALYEGDPAQGGKPVGSSTVPPLEPGKQFVVIVPWQLAGKAGARELFAVVDREGSIVETDDANNTASVSLSIPQILLSFLSQKDAYASDDEIAYRARIVNFSSETLRSLALEIQTSDPAGGIVSRGTVTLLEIPPGGERTIERPLGIASPKEGTYLVSGQVSSDRPLASDSLGITVLPTLLLAGTLEGTPSVAVPCAPFEVRYAARDAGNVTAVNGTLKIEIRSSARDQVLFAKQLPFRLQPGMVRLENIDLPRGDYSIVFRGSAVNSPWNLSREYLLDRRPLTVAGPVEMTRSAAVVPRVLVWAGGDAATLIEQALAEKMISEAFDGQAAYHELVRSAEVFRAKALTGVFNTFVLLEVGEIGGSIEALQHVLGLGHGVVIMGPGDHSRSIAESLGFRFAPAGHAVSNMSFPPDTDLGLTGSLPVSGQVLSVARDGAAPVALLPDGTASAVLGAADSGKVLVAPFSPVHSALDAGSSVPYGLLIRSAVSAVLPGQEGPDASAVQLRFSSPSGPVKARIIETLPAGGEVLWMSAEGKKDKGTLTFETTAGKEPDTITYLFRAPGTDRRSTTEVFFECGGKFVSQGKIE
jgi:hypothetical protein